MDKKNNEISARLTQIRVTICNNKTRIFAQKTGINENERLRMEVERLREKLRSLSGETVAGAILQ